MEIKPLNILIIDDDEIDQRQLKRAIAKSDLLAIVTIEDSPLRAIKLLQEYDWTGNIRELRNVVERLIILGGNEISENDVQLFASK